MAHIIDTSVAIHLRDREPVISGKAAKLPGPVFLSIVSHVELEGGVYSESADIAVRRTRLDEILRLIPVLAFDRADADAYRRIVETLGYSRRKVIDRMIAAQALVHRATLITCNGDDFRDVPGLQLLEW